MCEELFEDFVDRVTSVYSLWGSQASPWGFMCTCPSFKKHGMCKYVIKFGWEKGVIDCRSDLDFTVLARNKKRGRPKKVGICYVRDVESD